MKSINTEMRPTDTAALRASSLIDVSYSEWRRDQRAVYGNSAPVRSGEVMPAR